MLFRSNTFLWPVDPFFVHSGRFPPAFWGSRVLLGVQNGPRNAQKGPKWPKMDQNGAKMAQNGQNLEILAGVFQHAKIYFKLSGVFRQKVTIRPPPPVFSLFIHTATTRLRYKDVWLCGCVEEFFLTPSPRGAGGGLHT